jgi:hypothetical protein
MEIHYYTVVECIVKYSSTVTHTQLHSKKGYRFSRPQQGCYLPHSLWPGIIKLFPARESLVSDIPAEDGNIVNLFYNVNTSTHPLVLPADTHKEPENESVSLGVPRWVQSLRKNT